MPVNIFYSFAWCFIPSLILATLVITLYYKIQGLRNESEQMDEENIRNNESLKEYKFRAKLLIGIVAVFIFSTIILTAYLVSYKLNFCTMDFSNIWILLKSQVCHFSWFHQLKKNAKLSHNLFWRLSYGKQDICLWPLTVHPTTTSTSSYRKDPKPKGLWKNRKWHERRLF